MSEWSNEHDWKSCIRHKRIGGSNPPLSATQKAHQLRCAFCVLLRRDLNRERANLFACSPLGEKIVQCTILRVWSPQSENPPLSAIKKGCRAHPFFMGKVIIEGDLMGEQIAVAIFLLKQT